LSQKDEKLWELKEAAKWSLSLEERKKAIADLVNNYGENALPVLSEIKDTTVHEEIKKVCVEATMSAGKAHAEPAVKKEIPSTENANQGVGGKKQSGGSRRRSKKGRRR